MSKADFTELKQLHNHVRQVWDRIYYLWMRFFVWIRKKKEEEELLLIGNQARLNIFQWEMANELKYLQTEKTGILLFFRLLALHIIKCPLTLSTLFWSDFWKCLVFPNWNEVRKSWGFLESPKIRSYLSG